MPASPLELFAGGVGVISKVSCLVANRASLIAASFFSKHVQLQAVLLQLRRNSSVIAGIVAAIAAL